MAASDESACTGGSNTWHTAEYYDPIADNNTVTIAAQTGTGAGHPDAPKNLRVVETPVANIVQWEAVETLNGFPVTHYQVPAVGQPMANAVRQPEGNGLRRHGGRRRQRFLPGAGGEPVRRAGAVVSAGNSPPEAGPAEVLHRHRPERHPGRAVLERARHRSRRNRLWLRPGVLRGRRRHLDIAGSPGNAGTGRNVLHPHRRHSDGGQPDAGHPPAVPGAHGRNHR